MAKKATAKQLAARKKFVAMVKAKAAKKTGTSKKSMPITNKVTGGKNGKMPMVNGKPAFLAKKSGKKSASSMMKQERMVEKKTKGQPKTAREKMLEKKISKLTGKKYKGKR